MYNGKHTAKEPVIINKLEIKKPEKPKKKGYLRLFILWSLMITLLLGAGGYVFTRLLEERIHGTDGSSLDSRVEAAGEDSKLPPYVSGQPVDFILMGNDKRGVDDDPGRSDTLMVLRMNPEKKIAYLLSIPRDTRVKIPGHGYRKINAAYQIGGTPLMIETVQEFTGLTINHVAIVDFQGFKEIIDALGGIDIDVEKDLKDEILHMDMHAGYQHLDGEEGLKYVRVRHVDDDFGRIGRQQKFLKAVLEKLMRLSSVFRIPQLAEIASRNVRTDQALGIGQMIQYGQMMKSIGRENLNMVTIPGTAAMVGPVSYVIADEQKTAWILERVRNDMPLELTDEEKLNTDIKVDVQNGSGKAGIAKKMADKLVGLNFKIREVGNASSFDYYDTQIVAAPGKEELARRVQSLLGFGRLISGDSTATSSDVVVIVGRDFVDGGSVDDSTVNQGANP